ncbi:hypothetical protein JCM21900_004180 [Sporobolomyces salmonicolor]
MKAVAWLLLALAGPTGLAAAHSSPPVSARIETAWPAPDLVTQYLETLALEVPAHLFPFISFLASDPTSHRSLDPPLRAASLSASERYSSQGISAAFVPEGTLQHNETLAVLEAAAARSLLLRGKGVRQSLGLALANREASVAIEAMRGLWEERERQVTAGTTNGGGEGETTGAGAMRAGCESWIDVAEKKACSVDEFWKVVGEEQKDGKLPILLPETLRPSERPRLYPFDHVSPPGNNPHLPRVVLYGSPTSPSFQSLFAFLYQLSEPKPLPVIDPKSSTPSAATPGAAAPHPPRLQFALRWKPSSGAIKSNERLVLSGYGAALDVKKSDYLAIDDRMSAASVGEKGESSSALDRDAPLEIEGDMPLKMEPVKKSDIAELSVRATDFIMSSDAPFQAFTALTSSFPLMASHLSTVVRNVSSHLLSEVAANQMSFPALTMRPFFSLNGMALTDAQVDPFALLRLMRKERKYVTDLESLDKHMSSKAAREILINGQAKSGEEGKTQQRVEAEVLGELFDATDRDEGEHVILWWNDLEKDRRYKSWSTSVRDLLRPVYPGSMNLIAKNLNNVIFVLDLSQPAALALLAENVKQFVSRGIPVRFGLVPVVGESGEAESVETMLAQVVWYLVDALGRAPTMSFLTDLYTASPEAPITPDLLLRAYMRLAAQSTHVEGGPLASFHAIQDGVYTKSESLTSRLSRTREYLKRLGIPLAKGENEGEKSAIGAFFMNGAYFPIDDEFSQNLQRTLGLHTQFLQQEVYVGALTNDMDAKSFFADLPTTHKRRNPYIFPSAETNPLRIVNLVDAFKGVDPAVMESFYVEGVTGMVDNETGFDIEDPPASATMFIIADVNEPAGIQLAKAALQLVDKDTSVRISFIHNPVEHYEAHPWTFSNLLYLLHSYQALEDVLPIEFINWIDLTLDVGGPLPRHGMTWTEENPLRSVLLKGVEGKQAGEASLFWEELQWLSHQLGFQPGQNGIVINGRVVGPFPDGAFGLADLRALLSYELEKRIYPVVAAIQGTDFDMSLLERSHQSHLFNLASSIVQEAYLPDSAASIFGTGAVERRRDYVALHGNHSAFTNGNLRSALYEIVVVVDPATELAQRWAPIIQTLASLDTVHLDVYLNPNFHLTELPIKRFYQYTFSPALEFDESTGKELQPSVRFDGIPEDVLLTFGIDAQQSWLAFPKTSVHDLDNIRLADLPEWSRKKGVEAVLELESIIVEGHARDMPSSKPPRGLQLELRSGGKASPNEKRVDTIVMANLGYFQFKANPGPWRLTIRPGKSSDVFDMESIGANGWKSGDVSETGDSLVVSTLEGLTLYPRFRRKPGHELTELLDELADVAAKRESASLVNRLKSMIPFLAPQPGSTDLITTGKRADINVFTVASGLLYERMAFIMIVSVLRHTKSTVKFWFIQNFLSPSFKAFIPHMAREYGFEYELVTYKWPHWLRAQKEKQRTIWGYKILFLDVLFPLELDRVIFVDSDQIVRADLKELIDLDLQGAPYAYAPMGNDREETKGFRFWETGYWKQHLAGKPYHISALYVVDLDRFRQIAAGDRLRQQYQGLSADPNSLANLDQDLPNNMQTSIPIYTLDRSWLWCQTWCSDESLEQAKTIDLCNNPLTKEPKLVRAKRLIPEWITYDEEVAALARRIAESSASSPGEVAAFGTKADELEQAVQQQKEREEVLGEMKGADLVKDEL